MGGGVESLEMTMAFGRRAAGTFLSLLHSRRDKRESWALIPKIYPLRKGKINVLDLPQLATIVSIANVDHFDFSVTHVEFRKDARGQTCISARR